MSPLLASLTLLALCWQPSVSRKVESSSYQNMGSYIVKEQPQVGASIISQVKTGGGEITLDQVTALLNLMPNTVLALGFMAKPGALAKLKFLDDPLGFGVMCELDDPNMPEKLNEILYNGPPSAALKQKMAKDFHIDCAENPPTSLPDSPGLSAASVQKFHKCFCAEDKGVYCAFALIFKFALSDVAAQKKIQLPEKLPCLDETIPALLKAGSGALGATWKDLKKFGPETFNYAVSDNVEAFSSADKADLLCDAVNPEVEKAVKAVYASNAVYWFAEIFMFAKAFPPQKPTEEDKSLSDLCSDEAVRENAYGKCVCKQDTGFTFCIYKVIAEYFINEGFLTCDKADKTKQTFIAERKPRALPNMVNATDAAASIGAPTGSAATSSLTIATLAAAALLLINH